MVGCALAGYVELLGIELSNFALPGAPLLNIEEVCKATVENKYTQVGKHSTFLCPHFI